jgi:hypothetical protein
MDETMYLEIKGVSHYQGKLIQQWYAFKSTFAERRKCGGSKGYSEE